MSEPAESLAEPFELLVGPAMPHVDLAARTATPVAHELDADELADEPDDEVLRPDVEAVEPGPVAADRAVSGRAVSGNVPASRVVSGRGVTGRGIVVMILLVTGVVGLIEVTVAGHRGHAFAIAFVVTAAIGALVVRPRDLPTAIIAPPLLYSVLIVAMSAIDRNDETGGLLTREGVYIGNAFVTGAPALWAGAAATVVIAWYRRRTSASRVAPAKPPKPARPARPAMPVDEEAPPAKS
ncbi:MAG TPA: DUF6542 domain-containing protein [Acidothermaceae bacterium]